MNDLPLDDRALQIAPITVSHTASGNVGGREQPYAFSLFPLVRCARLDRHLHSQPGRGGNLWRSWVVGLTRALVCGIR